MARGGVPDSRSEQSAFSLMSFACGALTGAALALMFAPATGRETRSFVQDRSRRLADDVADRSRQVWKQQRENVSSAIQQGREAAGALGDRISEAVEQGKAGYREAKRDIEEGRDVI